MKKLEDLKSDIREKYYAAKYKVQMQFYATKSWCEKHPDLAIAAASGIIFGMKGVGRAARSIDRKIDMKRQQEMMDTRIYVPGLHKHVELRRPMTRKETIEYDRRKSEGESIVAILYDMGLLK